MPLSNDNQDYGQSDEQNKEKTASHGAAENKMTSDDLKGKKVDRDPEDQKDQPAEQQK